MSHRAHALPAPAYAAHSLSQVMPAVATSLGTGAGGGETARGELPRAQSAVVVLIDGMGYEALLGRRGHAPWLGSMMGAETRIDAGFPSTTATSMGSFGTGLTPGAHGLLGYELRDPSQGRILNELSWEHGPVPERWQPQQTWFERLSASGVEVLRTGPHYVDGSGLTRAALRGGRFAVAPSLAGRVDATLHHVHAHRRALAYLYWEDLDKVGHVHGVASWQWAAELEGIDHELQRLAAGLPPGCSLTITADHGMVDIPPDGRIDIAAESDLARDVNQVGGEPRALYLYVRSGAESEVLARWQERFSDQAWVLSRDEAIDAALFGDVAAGHIGRLGEVIVAMREPVAVVDSRHHRRELISLIGMHGSLTEAEVAVPLLHQSAP